MSPKDFQDRMKALTERRNKAVDEIRDRLKEISKQREELIADEKEACYQFRYGYEKLLKEYDREKPSDSFATNPENNYVEPMNQHDAGGEG